MHWEGRKLAALAACAILLAIFALNSSLSWRHTSPTFDEPVHLVAARIQTQLSDFRSDPENPPLWKYYLALGSPGGAMPLNLDSPDWSAMLQNYTSNYPEQTLYGTPGLDVDRLVRAARDRMLLCGVLLGALIAWWAWRLAGPVAAIVSASFFCFDPNFLAHSSLIKNDVAIALEFTALMFALWSAGRKAGILNCLAVAALAGAAVTTKFSGFLAIPFLAAALLLRAIIPTDWPVLKWTARGFAPRLLTAAAIGASALIFVYLFIWSTYAWRFASNPDPQQNLGLDDVVQGYRLAKAIREHGGAIDTPIEQLRQWYDQEQPDWSLRSVLWADDLHLVPRAFSRGFLITEEFTYTRQGYLLGQISGDGWWYYLPVAIAVKTPLATLIASALAAGLFWMISRPRSIWSTITILVVPVIYGITVIRSNMDVGVRHFLPLYPFLFIALGVVAASAVTRFGRRAAAIVGILLLALAVETCSAFPNYLPFFNVAAGGYRGGARILSDSNIDWGQNLPALADWQRQHPQYQLMLCYFGTADPRYYGIHYQNLPGSSAPDDQATSDGRPQYSAISVVYLQGPYLDDAGRQFYQPFKDRRPTEILGGGIYLYAPN